MFGVLKLVWQDGHENIVDLRPVLGKGPVFKFLRDDPTTFQDFKIDKDGDRLFWVDPYGDEVDFGTFGLRERADRQAALLTLAS